MSSSAPDGYVQVLSDNELAEGSLVQVEVEGDVRVLAKLEGGEVRALTGICTHEEAELAEGDLEGTTLWCPFHAAGFDVESGAATCLPASEPLRRYDVKVEDGQIFVAREPLPLPAA
jgi:nitrite reductase/ring-hydroxylating ferredoxin subunit